jgi:uncharacterized protein YbbC (DUF1343 family)/CubicO group peptidase (beta-lactamase class C family)
MTVPVFELDPLRNQLGPRSTARLLLCFLSVYQHKTILAVVLLLGAASTGAAQNRTKPAPKSSPQASFKAGAATSGALSVVDSIIQDAIRDHKIPGGVLLVGHGGKVVYRKAYGSRAIEPRREAMTTDTIFDLASLTKVVATTTCVMRLFEQGKIRLNDPVARYLPEFAQNGKDEITVRQLLVHYSGLREDLDLKDKDSQGKQEDKWEGKDTAYRLAFAEKPIFPAGSRFLYSDINFITLGALVERVSGESLDAYAAKNVFQPLGMTHTRYRPPAAWKSKTAPTEYDDNHVMLRGVVHDPTAQRMGGVAGHAGVFSTADDLAKFAQALLNGGGKVLAPVTVEKMTTPQQPPNATAVRGFGWDLDSPFSSNRGELLPIGSYGHTGFTGTSLWIDPATDTYIILLTNAVHIKGGSAIALRTKVASAVAAALQLTVSEQEKMRLAKITGYNESMAAGRRVNERNGVVKTGIDVLEENNFYLLLGDAPQRRVGLLTNQTGMDSQGRRTIDVLKNTPRVSLDAIFSPEHGVAGTQDTINIGDSKDATTEVPVYSVYGGTDEARRPSLDVLKNLDVLVIDLQDVGARFYTYETTLGYFLEAAAKAQIPVLVLDRPNPITGAVVQGPVADAGHETFTNYFPLPVRHGMTMGELAQLFNAERGIHAQLYVSPLQGWMRGDWYDETGLAWVNPSPNLRNLTEAALYPGVALVEGTNVSVGRGTDTPFEVVGAPWVNSRELAQYLNGRGIAGVRFVPLTFTPSASNHAGKPCQGVNLVLLDRNALDAPELGLELAAALEKLYPQQFHLDPVKDMLVNADVFEGLTAGHDPRRIADDWREGTEAFQKLREQYLLYK